VTTIPCPVRCLIVVRRARRDLCEALAREHPEATVVLDRRRGADAAGRTERRTPVMEPERRLWEKFGYRIVYRRVGVAA
jgi:hypothetical protein